MSKRLSVTQKRWSATELEGFAVVEACHQFRHFLANCRFKIFCDQHGFVCALSPTKGPKSIKNKKFARWRVELSEFDFTIHHLPGKLNTAADALSRISSIAVNTSHSLVRLQHEQFGHPGARRLFKLIQASKDRDALSNSNLSEMCSTVVKNCQICAEVKPCWRTPPSSSVVHATEPWQRLSMDFMTGKPVSQGGYTNLLTIIDEYSRFLFAFPTKDRTSATVISCLKSLFQIFGPPQSLHSDRGPEFFSLEISHFLSSWNVHQSRTTPYNPTGNSQCERYIWSALANHPLFTSPKPAANILLAQHCWRGSALHKISSLLSNRNYSTRSSLHIYQTYSTCSCSWHYSCWKFCLVSSLCSWKE